MAEIVLLIIIAAIIIYAAVYAAGGGRRKKNQLLKRYYELMGMPRRVAEETLSRQKEVLQKKFPGKTEEWYLEKIIFDLEKDKH